MNRKNLNILVTGAGGDSGLATIRILKDSGYRVTACDCNILSSGLYLADYYYVIPSAKQEMDFLKAVKRIVKKKNIDVIFPNVDEELRLFAIHKEEISANIVISDLNTIKICQNKIKAIEYFKDIIPVPETDEDIRSFPVVVRPIVSRGSKNVYLAKNRKEVLFFKRYIKSENLIPMVQEYLPGKEYTVDAVCDFSGNLMVAVPRQRLSVKGGICSIGRTVKNKNISILVKKITENLKFKGPINIQFKEDSKGILKLLEINPRCSGGLPITYTNGINIPDITIKLLYGNNIKKGDLIYRDGVVFRYLNEVK